MCKQHNSIRRWFFGFIPQKLLIGDEGPGDMAESDDSLEEIDRMLKRELKKLPKMKCSPGVREEILRLTVKKEMSKWRLATYEWKSHWKLELAVAGAAMAFVMLFVVKPQINTREPVEVTEISVQADLTPEEQKAAEEKIRWTLAYTSQLLAKSEKKAIGEAVVNELPKTLRNTLKKTVPLFKGGES